MSPSSWVSHGRPESDPSVPRGSIDLLSSERGAYSINVDADKPSSMPMPSLLFSPTPHVLRVRRNSETVWKVCFDAAQEKEEWTQALRDAGVRIEGSEPHGLEAGDHVIRWEIIVVAMAYPIQIHGIVLDAGKNCVIIADFGLTSYHKKARGGDADGDVSEGDNGLAADVQCDSAGDEREHNSAVMEAWKKMRPKERQRLNVIAYTEEKEIKKWKKLKYESNESGSKKGGSKFGKKFPWFRSKSNSGCELEGRSTLREASAHLDDVASSAHSEGGQMDADRSLPMKGQRLKDDVIFSPVENEPEWFFDGGRGGGRRPDSGRFQAE